MSEVDACLELLLSSTVNQLSLVMKMKAVARTKINWMLVEIDDIRRCKVDQEELLKVLEEYIKTNKETKP